MARSYRFFARHLLEESFPTSKFAVFHLTETLEPEIFQQLTRVLRVKSGDGIIFIPARRDAPFPEYHYTVRSAQKKEISLVFQKKILNENELGFDLELLLCLPNRPDKLDFILQKAVELGVKKITLVSGDNSQFKHEVRTDRLEKILMEAAEQSERAVVPAIMTEGRLCDYLEKVQGSQRIFVAMERSNLTKNLQELSKNLLPEKSVTVLVGPEGGFSPEEKRLIHDLGLQTFTLGRRVLRMETAAIVSLGILSAME